MFTGIIEAQGRVISRKSGEGNVHFGISAPFNAELKIDQSIAHNGVCLTVVELAGDHYVVTAIAETLRRSNLGSLAVDDIVNLERCVKVGDRLDGHIVQGHVDTTATCAEIREEKGSWLFRFRYDEKSGMTVEKGSICVNGVSLTVVDSLHGEFSVAIIPYTYEHTNFNRLKTGDKVNLEFDIVGKYVAAMIKK